ncbi:MAG: hypothetical protein U0797_12770 [Gemmataceae bacterium]
MLVAALGLTAAAAPAPGRRGRALLLEGPRQRPGGGPQRRPAAARPRPLAGLTRFRHGDIIRSLGFTPDGKRLVSHGPDGVRVWDASTGREVSQLLATSGRWINAGILSRDGTTVVTAEPGVARLRRLPDLKVKREFALDQVRHLRLSPDGKLLSGVVQKHSKSWLVEIWEVESGKRRHSWEAHQDSVWCHDFTPDGKAVVTAGGDKRIRFQDVTTAARSARSKSSATPTWSASWPCPPTGPPWRRSA